MATEIGRGVIPVSLDANAVGSGLTGLQTMMKSRLGKVGLVGGAALAGGVTAAVAGGSALYKVGKSFNDMRRTIIVGTGASGKALKQLERDAARVGRHTPSNFGDIGTAIADVNTRLGLTGKPLRTMATGVLNLSRLTGTDLSSNIANITRVFGDWGVKTKDQPEALDKVFEATKRTGIGLDELTTKVVQFGAPMRQFGFTFEESLALFGKWEKEGVNTQVVLAGLKQGLGRFSAEGREPVKALEQVTTAIKGAGSAGEANRIAIEAFGQRAGPDMAAAVREGRFELGDLVKGLEGSKGALKDADKRTRTFTETWQIFKNRVLKVVEPLATRLFDAIGKGALKIKANMGSIMGAIRPFVKMVETTFDQTIIPAFKDIAEAVKADLLPAIQRIMPVLAPVVGFIVKVLAGAVVGAIKGVIQAFKGIVNVIDGVVKLVKAIITGDWKAAWKALKQIVSGVLDTIVGLFKVWWNVSILGIFKKGALALLKGWKSLWVGFKKLAGKAWDGLVKLFKSALGLVTKVVVGAVRGYISLWVGLFKGLVKLAVTGWKVLRSAFGGALAAIRTVFTEAMKAIKGKFLDAWTFLKSTGRKMVDFFKKTIPDAFSAGKRAIERFWSGVQSAAKKPAEFVVNTVWNNGLRKVINAIPGVKEVPEIRLFAEGGPVSGGRRGRDSVPALLMPGEHVLTTEEVQRLGGQKQVLAMRRAIRSGEFSDLGDLPRFAKGGFLSPDAIARAQAWAKTQVGKPYLWGGVGPGGYDCSGFMSAITNVLLGRSPHTRLGATATFPWAGFRPGHGQFTIGSFRGSPGHMAGTLGGLNVESAGGVGVRVGSSARGAGDRMFNTVAHLGAAGDYSAGGQLVTSIKDLFSKLGGWVSELTSMGGWGGLLSQMVKSVMGGLKSFIKDKGRTAGKAGVFGLLGSAAAHLFDNGGILRHGGIGINASGRPEAVLDPQQTLAFQALANALVRAPRSAAVAHRVSSEGEWRMRITNWAEGEGVVRWVARDEVDAAGEHGSTLSRMGGGR